MSRAEGQDIHYQYQVAAGWNPGVNCPEPDFIIPKLTEGKNARYVDIKTGQMASEFLVQGAYHYGRSGHGWEQEAENYLNTIEWLNAETGFWPLFHCYDFERVRYQNGVWDNTFSQEWGRNIKEWLDFVEKETLQPAVLYTNPANYQQGLWDYGQRWMDDYELWIAQYPAMDFSKLAGYPSDLTKQPWLGSVPSWRIWQYGISTHDGFRLDRNIYNGTLEELCEWVGLGDCAPVDPPPIVIEDPIEEPPVDNGLTELLDDIRYLVEKIMDLVADAVDRLV